jgi:hypothetical protein
MPVPPVVFDRLSALDQSRGRCQQLRIVHVARARRCDIAAFEGVGQSGSLFTKTRLHEKRR